jgi:hypothetical protein
MFGRTFLQPMPVALCTAKLAHRSVIQSKKKDELNPRYEKSYFLLFYFSCTLLKESKTPPNFGQKEIFLLFQSAYNKQWLGAEHLTWLVILVLTTTSTIKGCCSLG